MTIDLTGRRALVTGGSRGIGRAVVLALARQGAAVAACYHRESDAVAELASDLEQQGQGCFVLQAVVSDEQHVAALADAVRERLGQVDVLVNNAGVVSHMTLGDLGLDEWRRVIDTNLTSIYLVTRSVLDLIPAGGSVVNVTSGVALRGMPARTHYTASKAGIIGFTRSLAKEVGPRGIRANCVAPGIIETDQVSGLTPEQRTRYENLAALGRLGLPNDVADVVVFLASDLSRFVSGQTITVDGGI